MTIATPIVTSTSTASHGDVIPDELRGRLARRIATDHPELSQAEIDSALDGALGFLKLCAAHPGHAFTPSRRIDIAWHAFLLHTRDYHGFCDQVAGRYIHHEPTDGSEPGETDGLERTIQFMEERQIPYDPEVWHGAADCEEGSCESCRSDCSSGPS